MEFALVCPNDGQIALGLESVTAVVFHGTESVEVVFTCPHCGATLRALLPTPNVIAAAAMEVVRQINEVDGAFGMTAGPTSDDVAAERRRRESEQRREREQAGEPYCEYFRRQLAEVECVEDFLAETE
ncbi:MAG: hypothetical protein JW733_05940 [Coriobacteriia bacterium]|nr:hypothetical protein [Coriobacteriia bacterium]MBN2839543.1 hypothetical protein [Coriobacteriia bacterium]